MSVADAERKARAVHPLIEFHYPEHLGAGPVHGVLFVYHGNMPEAQSFVSFRQACMKSEAHDC